ncbi:unnamed protein product, partial [Laminaria digitata]
VYHFGFISLAGILLNIVALPLTAAALGAGLLMVLSASFSSSLGAVLGNTTESLIALLIAIAEYGSSTLSFMQIETGEINLPTFICLVFIATILAVYQLPKYRWKYVAVFVSIIMLFNAKEISTSKTALSVVFFDVGHGDASLIHFPNGSTLLIDTGNKNQFTNQAKQVILPYLHRKGISTLDALVITHPHLDHMGGLETLLASVSVKKLIGGDTATVEKFNQITASLSRAPNIRQVSAGDTLALDASVRIRILSPPPSLALEHNPNERSVVLQIQYGHTTFLFLGDAESLAEQSIHTNFPVFLHSDVVKVAHHGSRTSSSDALINAATKHNNVLALISVGASSSYGLPDEEIIDRWITNNAEVHVTAESGALWIKSDGRHIWTIPF